VTNTVYLDYNATAPVKPAVVEAVAEAMTSVGNPSSVHAAGRAARRLMSRAREQVAALVGAAPDQVIFTSGGTEANNQALAGSAILASAIEHPSVLVPTREGPTIPVDAGGIVDLQAVDHLVEIHGPAVLAVMLANNETGVIQPVRAVAERAREAGIRLHVDAIQAAGKMPLRFSDLGADTLSLSAHKLGGPLGIGALILREPGSLPALLQGGAQEQRARAGTENVPGIVGFGKAAALALDDHGFSGRVGGLRDRLEAGVKEIAPEASIIGDLSPRLPTTTCLMLPGISHETQLIHFDLAGIAVSAGSACSSGKVGVSPVLAAMGLSVDEASSAIRISLGWNNSEQDVDRFLDACRTLLERHRLRQRA